VPTLDKVTVDLMVVLGTTSMPVHQVMRLSRGAIIELDATEADEVKILANNLPIASGVVLVDRNRIAVEVKQMLPRLPGTRKADFPVCRHPERFPAKWIPVRVNKTRQNKRMEPSFRFNRNEGSETPRQQALSLHR
jgi:flagellar motor switch protein FliN/FliY